jgi:hypothetical protein
MNSPSILKIGLVLGVVLLGSSEPLQAQEGILLRFDAGLVTPFGATNDYFDPGPSISGGVEFPLRERLSILANVSVDHLNNNDFWPVPDTRLWRYQVGLQADLLRAAGAGLALQVFGLIGAGTTESDRFLPENFELPPPGQLPESHELMETGFSGSGGVRLGFGLNNITSGWLSAQVNYNSGDENRLLLLQDAVNDTLDPISSITTAAVRLGFAYRLGGGI